ncbi:hypothetical protein ACWENA_32580 [Streptomyces sp. NPDC004779]
MSAEQSSGTLLRAPGRGPDAGAGGQSISASRYDGYWNKALPLKVKNIDFTFLTDGSAITSGLLSGQIYGTYQPPTAAPSTGRASAARCTPVRARPRRCRPCPPRTASPRRV